MLNALTTTILLLFGLGKITPETNNKGDYNPCLTTFPPNCSYCQNTMLPVLFKILAASVSTDMVGVQLWVHIRFDQLTLGALTTSMTEKYTLIGYLI